MEVQIKRCFRCKKKIDSDSNYFGMVEMNKKKKVRVDYVHKLCWNTFINQLDSTTASLNKSNYLLNALEGHMRKTGMLPEEEVEIKC